MRAVMPASLQPSACTQENEGGNPVVARACGNAARHPRDADPAKGGRISLGIHTRVLPRCYQSTSHQHAGGELRLTPDHQSYVVLDRPASAQIGPERNS